MLQVIPNGLMCGDEEANILAPQINMPNSAHRTQHTSPITRYNAHGSLNQRANFSVHLAFQS
jgi:hypothetical protein